MSGMFNNCGALTALDLSNFNTEYVKDMKEMFKNCYNLTSLDLSNFNTRYVTDMSEMFSTDTRLKTIYANELFKLYALRNGDNMFYNCTSLEGAIKYDKSKADYRYANYTNGYFTYKASTNTDISGINAEEEDRKTEYFDLQGNRLNNLTHGVNIVRKGNRSSKVVMK